MPMVGTLRKELSVDTTLRMPQQFKTPITAPFDIPSNAKRTYILTGNATNVWEYRCEVLFFDGTKRDFTFKINIDNGKITRRSKGYRHIN